jgi:hypothetical protein
MTHDGMVDLSLWTELRMAAYRAEGIAWSNRTLEEILVFKAAKHGVRVLMDPGELDPSKTAAQLVDWNGALLQRPVGRDEAFKWLEENGDRLDSLRRADAERIALSARCSDALRVGTAGFRL